MLNLEGHGIKRILALSWKYRQLVSQVPCLATKDVMVFQPIHEYSIGPFFKMHCTMNLLQIKVYNIEEHIEKNVL